jgi:hypothetical protein
MTTRASITLSIVALVSVLLSPSVHAQDPTTADCLAAAEKSTQFRQQHRLRSARAELLICAASSCPSDIQNECARRVSEVNSSMPTIVFEVKDPVGNDMSAVQLTMDGQRLVERLEGTALSIDPGEHVFQFESPGMDTVLKRFVIRVGEKERRERVQFKGASGTDEAAQAATALTPAASRVQRSSSTPALGSSASAPIDAPSRPQRTVGYIVGGTGVAAIALAIYQQSVALSRDSLSQDAAANTDTDVQATASELHEQAKQAQTYALVFGTVGLSAVGVGLYLLLSSSASDASRGQSASAISIRPHATAETAGLVVHAKW